MLTHPHKSRDPTTVTRPRETTTATNHGERTTTYRVNIHINPNHHQNLYTTTKPSPSISMSDETTSADLTYSITLPSSGTETFEKDSNLNPPTPFFNTPPFYISISVGCGLLFIGTLTWALVKKKICCPRRHGHWSPMRRDARCTNCEHQLRQGSYGAFFSPIFNEITKYHPLLKKNKKKQKKNLLLFPESIELANRRASSVDGSHELFTMDSSVDTVPMRFDVRGRRRTPSPNTLLKETYKIRNCRVMLSRRDHI
jgi:hypothetical protein